MTASSHEKERALIAELEDRIREGEEDGESEDDASWGYETGILLTRAQARIALAALRAAPSGEPPTEPSEEAEMLRAVMERFTGDDVYPAFLREVAAEALKRSPTLRVARPQDGGDAP